MKNYMKFTLLISIMVCMFAVLTVTASAQTVASGTCGTNVTWVLNDEGTLTISGMGSFTSSPWKSSFKDDIINVVVEEGITYIPGWAFSGCSNLKSIVIADSVQTIEREILKGCNSLEELTVPFIGHTINSLKNESVLGYFFGYDFSKPSSGPWVLQYYNTAASAGGNAYRAYFYIPSTLRKVTITKDTDLEFGAFYNVKSLTEINLPDTMTYIRQNAFYNCTGITDIDIPSSVIYIGLEAFSGCTNLAKVNVTDLAAWCNIDFTKTNTVNSFDVTSNPLYYSNALYLNDELLTDVVIPDTVTTIKSWTFFKCNSIKSIFVPESVTKICEGAFYGCNSLEKITIPFIGEYKGHVHSDYYGAFGYIFGFTTSYSNGIPVGYSYHTPSSLKKVTLTNELSVCEYAFSDCTNLTEMILSDTVTQIGNSAFANLTKLTKVVIGKGVKDIEQYAFYGCNELQTVYYPGTEKEWKNINISSRNDSLLNANIICMESNTMHIAINEYSIGFESGEITGNVLFDLYGVKDDEAKLIVAVYDIRGNYVGVNVQDIVVNTGIDNVCIDLAVPVSKTLYSGKIRLFLWKMSNNSITPCAISKGFGF